MVFLERLSNGLAMPQDLCDLVCVNVCLWDQSRVNRSIS